MDPRLIRRFYRLVDSNLVDDPGWFEGRLHGGGFWIFVDIPQV